MARTLCIYLHGFNSTPATTKAAVLKKTLIRLGADVDFIVPALPVHAHDAIAHIENIIKTHKHNRLVMLGSSLGGFYAAYFAERYGIRIVLINPAFDELFDEPYDLLGEHENRHTGEKFHITPQDYEDLRTLFVPTLKHPDRALLLLQTGDEVLNYRRVLARYPDSPKIVQVGGSHRFDNFAGMLDEIVQFLDLAGKG